MQSTSNQVRTYLQEAEEVVCLSSVTGNNRCLAELCSKSNTFSQRPVLNSCSEERFRVDFFPEVKARAKHNQHMVAEWQLPHIRGLVPIRGNVVKVKLDHRPYLRCHEGRVGVCNQPVRVSDQCGRPKGRSIALWPYGASKLGAYSSRRYFPAPSP